MIENDSQDLVKWLDQIDAFAVRNRLLKEPRLVLEALSRHPQGFEKLRDTGESKFEADYVIMLLEIGTDGATQLARRYADLLLSRCKGGVVHGLIAILLGIGATAGIIALAMNDSLPNPFSFSLVLYVLPLGMLLGPVMVGGYFYETLKVKRILKTPVDHSKAANDADSDRKYAIDAEKTASQPRRIHLGNLDKVLYGFGLIVFGLAIMIGITPIQLTGSPAVALGCVVALFGGGIIARAIQKTPH